MDNYDRLNQNLYGNVRAESGKENNIHKNSLTDCGPKPFVANIQNATLGNKCFRTTLWTGEYLQLTLMSIPAGEDIGLEEHDDVDQFLRVEQGQGIVMMGESSDSVAVCGRVYPGCTIIVPAGTWHNLINAGCSPLKLYSIYAPPEHPFGTVHVTKKDALADENHH